MFFRKSKYKKEFEEKCLKMKPCQACPHYSFRSPHRDQCMLEVKLKEKYNIKG